MTKRTKKNQTCHNASVAKRAAGLKANGWKVDADIKGYSQPNILNGSRPDIDATKRGRRRIIEVETPDSRFKDRQQHRNLREYIKGKKNTTVMVRTCNTN